MSDRPRQPRGDGAPPDDPPGVETSRGRAIETLCIACGWEKKSLARRIGVSDGTVSRWKEGKGPTPRNMIKLLEALGLPPEAVDVTFAYLRQLRRLERHGEVTEAADSTPGDEQAGGPIEAHRLVEHLAAGFGSDLSQAARKLLLGILEVGPSKE